MSGQYVSFSFSEIKLSVSDIWPDGDQPDVITADAIADVIRKCGPLYRVLNDWNIVPDLHIHVTIPNPAWTQDEALWLTSSAEVRA